MLIQKFQRKPFPVEGVRVTKENMQEVAAWCSGEIKTSGKKTKYIFISTHRPMTDRQTQAYVGDWILYAERGFKIYTQNAFARNFELVEAGTGRDHADFVPEEKQDEEDTPLPAMSGLTEKEMRIPQRAADPEAIRKLAAHFRPQDYAAGDPHR